MRPRRGKKLCIVVSFVIVICIYTLLSLSNGHQRVAKNFTFDLVNIPYSQLKNGSCILQENGRWKCPDIRAQGTNKLRQTQIVLMRMLLVFDALAKKYKLRYWITRGTLLGAARHRGFVPWDIDLDIEMPIEDYLLFLQKAVNQLPSGMIFQRHEKEQSLSRLTTTSAGIKGLHKLQAAVLSPWNPRIRDENSCYMTCLKTKCNWHDGLMVDIYPVMLSKYGYYVDQFDLATRIWRFFGITHGKWYKAFPLEELEFEGFKIPVPYEWRKQLQIVYGESYMELPAKQKQYPPDEIVPEPAISCGRLSSHQF